MNKFCSLLCWTPAFKIGYTWRKSVRIPQLKDDFKYCNQPGQNASKHI